MNNDDVIDLSGHFYVGLSVKAIREAGGDYEEAVREAIAEGTFGEASFSDVGDDNDNINFAMREEDET